MTNTNTLLVDTYVLIEIVKGNKNCDPYKRYNLVTTILNIMELYYYVLRVYSKDLAEFYFNHYKQFLVSVSETSIKEGMQFKFKYRQEKLSYVDCAGYARACELGIKFLTGDSKFKNKPNVEFVK